MSYITEVKLLSVPLENDYKHTLYFASKDSQKAYFDTKVKNSFSDFSFQQTNGLMRLPIPYDEAILSNYVMYKNKNKWYYAFIVDYQYYGEDQTNITIETDVIQTWMFDYTVLPSFIDREHVSDDTIGLHTFPEGLEMGEYETNFSQINHAFTDLKVVVGVTETSQGTLGNMSRMYNGMYSGIIYYAFPNTTAGHTALQKFIQAYADSSETTIDAIQCMFLAPAHLCPTAHDEDSNREDYYVSPSEETVDVTYTVSKSNWMINKNYQPKNNKLYCYPYRYLLVSNNNGASAIYQYEHFSQPSYIQFRVRSVLTPGCSVRAIPIDYKRVKTGIDIDDRVNNEEGINLGKYPILNWTSDVYTNWLTQNAVNIGLSLATGLGQTIAGGFTMYATGGVAGGGAVAGGVSSIVQQIGQIRQMSMTPPQSNGNTNCGDVITASGTNSLFFYGMTIKDEYMEIIDNFLSMFGYKCNKVKIPEVNHRENWWYTKTIDANISGIVPQTDLQTIKNCYNNGITFWKNPSNIKNYSVANGII